MPKVKVAKKSVFIDMTPMVQGYIPVAGPGMGRCSTVEISVLQDLVLGPI